MNTQSNNNITFTDYLTSIFANSDYNTSPGQFQLPKQELNQLTIYTLRQSAFSEFTKAATIENVSAATIVFRKLTSGRFKEKDTIGTNGEIDKMTFPSVEIKFSKPHYAREGLTQADLTLGLPNACAPKLQRFLIDYSNFYDEKGFAQIGQVIDTSVSSKKELDFENSNSEKIYDEIIEMATQLTLLNDYKEGIKYISRSDIVIAVEPSVFDKISKIGFLGNRVTETMSSGQYGIGTIGGYRIIAAPSLSATDYKVIVGTNFSCGGTIKINAANIGKVNNTNDLEVYFEAMKASGVVFPTTLRGIKHKATSESQ